MADLAIDLKTVLRPGSLLADLSEPSLEKLNALGALRRFPKGQTIFQKGDDGDFLAIVVEGRLKVCTFTAAGRESVLNILQAGDVVGEIAALDGGPRTADVAPLEDAGLFVIPRAGIETLLNDDTAFALSLTRALCAKLRAASDAVEASNLDMARRAAAALLRLAEQNQRETDEGDLAHQLRIDQTTLAQYVGITRSNLNRVLKQFERSGAARHEKGVLHILDLDWLDDFANSDDG